MYLQRDGKVNQIVKKRYFFLISEVQKLQKLYLIRMLNHIYAKIRREAKGPIRIDEGQVQMASSRVIFKIQEIVKAQVASSENGSPMPDSLLDDKGYAFTEKFTNPYNGKFEEVDFYIRLHTRASMFDFLLGAQFIPLHPLSENNPGIMLEISQPFLRLYGPHLPSDKWKEYSTQIASVLFHELAHMFDKGLKLNKYTEPYNARNYNNQKAERISYGQELYRMAVSIGRNYRGRMPLNELSHLAWKVFQMGLFFSLDELSSDEQKMIKLIKKLNPGLHLTRKWQEHWSHDAGAKKAMMDYFLKGIRDGYQAGA